MCADILFKFQIILSRKSVNRTLFGSLSSTSPPNKKTLYNHGAIHILVMAAKNKEPVSFLVLLQVLCFSTSNIVRSKSNKKPLLGEKNNVKKYYCDNDFVKTNYDILIHKQSVDC